MTKVQIHLPDDLAQTASRAGLLSSEAMDSILREELRRRSGTALRSMWAGGPAESLTPELEQELVDEVRRLRAHRRQQEPSR